MPAPQSILDSIEDPKKQAECQKLKELFDEWTGEKPEVFGKVILGYKSFPYKTKSGCEGTWFSVGFSPRKAGLSLYVVPYHEKVEALKKKLGKAKFGRSCINIKSIEDIDLKVLEKLVMISLDLAEETYNI